MIHTATSNDPNGSFDVGGGARSSSLLLYAMMFWAIAYGPTAVQRTYEYAGPWVLAACIPLPLVLMVCVWRFPDE